ncbi:hypothetical protein [Kitasatospora sp. NPDC057015]|uniref:hypothetical protein n=1 Tax=Kitasatospora sp. NPDC057015 TaxID=3346001 RepID=UPI003627040A
MDPARSAEWWKSLTPDQQKSYLTLHPEQVGRLDGLPSAVRDEANRLFLEQQNDALHVGKAQDFGITQNEFNARANAVRELKEKLDASDGDTNGRELLLLGIDPKGDGRTIVAMGNPETADHTAVLVPGQRPLLPVCPVRSKASAHGNNIKIDTHGHSGYWDQASASLLNQGKIIAGRPPATVDKESQVDPETVYPGGL